MPVLFGYNEHNNYCGISIIIPITSRIPLNIFSRFRLILERSPEVGCRG